MLIIIPIHKFQLVFFNFFSQLPFPIRDNMTNQTAPNNTECLNNLWITKLIWIYLFLLLYLID